MFELIKNGFNDLLPTIRQNMIPKPIFYDSVKLYPYRDTITYHEPLSKFEEIYSNSSNEIKIKISLFLSGIEKLINKNCQVSFIDFLENPLINELLQKSKSKDDMNGLIFQIQQLFESPRVYRININSKYRIMYDLTHINIYGARAATSAIFDKKMITLIMELFMSSMMVSHIDISFRYKLV